MLAPVVGRCAALPRPPCPPQAPGVWPGTPLRMRGVTMGSVLHVRPRLLERVEVDVEVSVRRAAAVTDAVSLRGGRPGSGHMPVIWHPEHCILLCHRLP